MESGNNSHFFILGESTTSPIAYIFVFFHSLPDNRFHSIKKILTNDPLICSERLYAFVLSTSTRQNNEIFIAPSNILLPNDVAM